MDSEPDGLSSTVVILLALAIGAIPLMVALSLFAGLGPLGDNKFIVYERVRV